MQFWRSLTRSSSSSVWHSSFPCEAASLVSGYSSSILAANPFCHVAFFAPVILRSDVISALSDKGEARELAQRSVGARLMLVCAVNGSADWSMQQTGLSWLVAVWHANLGLCWSETLRLSADTA